MMEYLAIEELEKTKRAQDLIDSSVLILATFPKREMVCSVKASGPRTVTIFLDNLTRSVVNWPLAQFIMINTVPNNSIAFTYNLEMKFNPGH